jgi:hypothetical protein
MSDQWCRKLAVTLAEKEQEVVQLELVQCSHSTEHLEHEKKSFLEAKLVALLTSNYECEEHYRTDTFNKNNEQRRNPDTFLECRGPHDVQF